MVNSHSNTGDVRFADLIDLTDPQKIFDEVIDIIRTIDPQINLAGLQQVFSDVIKLFEGCYPGYHACNTEYHNLQHTTDTTLAIARMIHGASLHGYRFSAHNIVLAIICSLMHDVGFIQDQGDCEGTGAKYTKIHVDRSIAFMRKYMDAHNYTDLDYENAYAILKCTGLEVNIEMLRFSSPEIEMLGKMLGTADLLGQMADRTYLEKLLFLYYEFQEGSVEGYLSEHDLLAKTIGFFEMTTNRLTTTLGGVNEHLAAHFKARWGYDLDFYHDATVKNREYLIFLLTEHPDEYRAFLRRGNIVNRLREKGL